MSEQWPPPSHVIKRTEPSVARVCLPRMADADPGRDLRSDTHTASLATAETTALEVPDSTPANRSIGSV
jgi:hypothetical protein